METKKETEMIDFYFYPRKPTLIYPIQPAFESDRHFNNRKLPFCAFVYP